MTRIFLLLLASLLSSCTNEPVTTQVAIEQPAIAASKPRPYYRDVQNLVAKHVVYPPESLVAGEQGVCKLRLMLRRDGSLANVEISQSSGFARLDEACIRAVYDPVFPAIPETIDAKVQEFFVDMPITFTLSP